MDASQDSRPPGGLADAVPGAGEEGAEETRSRLVAIVSSSDDAILSKDLNGTIISWNRGAEKLFGYTAAEAVGRSITMLMPPERQDEEPEVLARIRRGESIDHYETVRRRKDGSLIDISLCVSPVVDARGRIVGASKIARDITERKRSERILAEADRRKEEFLAMLAHELRNPMAPLRNSLEYLRQRGFEKPMPREVLEVMERQVNNLVRLVDDLMEGARISRGTIELRRENMLLADMVAGAVEISRPLIEARRHRLELAQPPQPLRLTGDLARLTQVLANLLNNAAKFTPPGGLIRLSAADEDGQLVVRVADNGSGIPADMLQAVFEPFTQAARAPGTQGGGLGIGLALVRQVVAMHGGTVEAASAGPGSGSEVLFRLPLPAVQPPEPVREPASAEPAPRTVLVVDENRDAAESLALALASLKHEVHVAHGGREALELAERVQPAVVLLDIGLPDFDGYQVAARMRAEPWGSGILLIALTGLGRPADRRAAREAGFDHHLVKPLDYDLLQRLLAEPGREPL